MNDTELMVTEPVAVGERNIESITGEIKRICCQAQFMALSYAVEIGRRLTEAKTMLKHGEWGDWLKDRVNFSQSTANNMMRLFKEYGDDRSFMIDQSSKVFSLDNLSYTKALQLLAIPAEEREEFAEQNDVANLSTRELEQAIKERDEALKARDAALEAQKKAEQAKQSGESELTALNQQKAKLEKQLQDVRTNAVKDAKKNFAQSEKKFTDRIKELESALAETKKTAADKSPDAEAVRRYEDEIARLQKQAAMADPDTTEFRTVFDNVQMQVVKLTEIIRRVDAADSEKAGKFKRAMQALANQMTGGNIP